MVSGSPTKRPFSIPVSALQAAREVGLDPEGPEMAALMKLSEGIVERIVWEIVPQLAEALIKENMDKLGKTG